MPVRILQGDDVTIATEAFGDPTHPPVILTMGVMSSILWWNDAFCQRLADQGRYVIRYDSRDTGLSTTYPVGQPPYGFDELADDIVRVLDGCGIPTAGLVGFSMGGMVAQLAALAHPERFRSLTVMSTSPLGEDRSALPGADAVYLERSGALGEPDWSERSQTISYLLEDYRLTNGPAYAFDEVSARRLIERDVDRSPAFPSATNHGRIERGGETWEGRLSELSVPLLVIHGTADPIFPIEHGQAIARAVKGATLLPLEGVGHELHRASWDEIIAAIVAHTTEGGPSPGAPATAGLVSSGYVTVDGLEMYYETQGLGESRPLLLLHGGLTTIATSFETVRPLLAQHRPTVAVEQQGHGHTADIDRPLTFEQMADDTAGVLRQLGIDRADVFGYSDGGNVALGLAIRHPELVGRLIVAGTNFNNDGLYPEIVDYFHHAKPEEMAPLGEAYARVAPDPDGWPDLVAKVMHQALAFTGWSPADLRGISALTLVIAGDDDIVRPEHAVELFRLIPNCRLAVLPETDHALLIDRAELLVPILTAFLDWPASERTDSPD